MCIPLAPLLGTSAEKLRRGRDGSRRTKVTRILFIYEIGLYNNIHTMVVGWGSRVVVEMSGGELEDMVL